MKIALLLSLFFVSTTFAQTRPVVLDTSRTVVELPTIDLATGREMTPAETRLDARMGQHDGRIDALRGKISDLADTQRAIQDRIDAATADMRRAQKNDGCLGRTEICSRHHSNPRLRENQIRAVALREEIAALESSKKGIATELASLAAEETKLAKEQAEIARLARIEQENTRKELARLARVEAEERARETADAAVSNREAETTEDKARRVAEAGAERAAAQNARALRALELKIKRRDVQSSFADLKLQENEIEDAIQVIEDTYDQSLMGVYVQQRIVAALESDALCKKASDCQAGKKTQLTQEEISKIFPKGVVVPKRSSGGNSGTR